MASYYQDPSIESSRQEAETAQTQASSYASASALLPDKLKQAVLGKLNYNKDLIEAHNKSMAEYFVAPSAAREKYQNIWNPFEREKLVATSRAQAYEPYANLTDLLGQRMGRVEDIVGAGVGAYQAQTSAAQAAADAKRRSYEDALNLAQLLTSEKLSKAQLEKSGGITAWQQKQLESEQLQSEQQNERDAKAFENFKMAIDMTTTPEEAGTIANEYTGRISTTRPDLAGEALNYYMKALQGLKEKKKGINLGETWEKVKSFFGK